jgi:hypothetical protein
LRGRAAEAQRSALIFCDSMGQYFIFVNPIKRQFLDADKFNEGVKSYSVLCGYHAYAVALLVCSLTEIDHSYGQLAGSWYGDPVIVAGDDEGEPDAYGIKTSTLENPERNLYWQASEEFEDINEAKLEAPNNGLQRTRR